MNKDNKETMRKILRKIGPFLEGSIDVQKELPFRTPEEIRKIVRSRINILGENGGFILAPSHNLQPDIPVENIIAIYEAKREYT